MHIRNFTSHMTYNIHTHKKKCMRPYIKCMCPYIKCMCPYMCPYMYFTSRMTYNIQVQAGQSCMGQLHMMGDIRLRIYMRCDLHIRDVYVCI